MECNKYGQCYDCYTCEQCITICEECGEICINCADSFCENCNTCSECNGDTVCETCYNTCGDCNVDSACPSCGDTCESCGNEDLCSTCHNCAACADICINCGDFCSMCDLDYNEATHMCGNCDVHDVDAAAVIGRINSIGTVELTPESKAKIDSAAAAYNALTAEQQVLVSNYNTLRAARARYTQLKNQEDTRKAKLVDAGINNLGTITLSS